MPYYFYLLQVLPDLPQPHGSIGEEFGLVDLLIEYLCEDHLKGHGYARLVKVFFEHLRLLLFLAGFVVELTRRPLTYSYCYCWEFLGLLGERGDFGASYLASAGGRLLLGSTFLPYYILISSLRSSLPAGRAFGGMQLNLSQITQDRERSKTTKISKQCLKISNRINLMSDPFEKFFCCRDYNTMETIDIYISALEGRVLFPYNQLRFRLPASIKIEKYQNLVGFCTKVTPEMEREGVEVIQGVAKFGTLLRIQRVDPFRNEQQEKDPVPKISYNGLAFAKFSIVSVVEKEGVMMASIRICSDQIASDKEQQKTKKGLLLTLKSRLKLYYECVLKANELENKKQQLDDESNIHKIVYQALNDIDLPILQKLKLLQMHNILQKLQILVQLLHAKTQNFKGIVDMQTSVKQAMLPLRKSIAKDNQFGFNSGVKNDQLAQKMKNKNIPEIVRLSIDKQMKNAGFGSDKMVSERYVETLLDIPWGEYSEDVKDISLAQKILNWDHTGMKEVKERVLEHLAVRFRKGNSSGNVICLHGPPGVGKTSIAKSIAKALARSFQRISLGGMGSEAQLRGHRRTYVSALPGVIIRALMRAKSSNPVILLDQIQKLGRGHKGDAENALLQIIDPSQNSSFVDHYVALPVDLSKVMFICTANSLDVSQPLLNRLETIQVPGYSRQEKAEIARQHIIPRQLKENAVEGLVFFDNSGIQAMIACSNELGVRGLQRNIAKCCRKIARTGRKEVVNRQWVQQHICAKQTSQIWSGVGVANGMAYTDLGGRVITIQALKFGSISQVKVTGQLGEVMKESVDIAVSWIRSNFQEMGLFQACKTLQERSIHLHVPDGSTKKDGPSAGITVLTCLASLILKVPPRESLAMTGEITLSGKVLPVGSVRQKCMAAIYKGIKHIILPEANLKDLDKLDEDIKKQAAFYGIKEVKEALVVAFPNVFDKIAAKL